MSENDLHSFSEGVRLLNEKGALRSPVRLNDAIRQELLTCIKEEKSLTCDLDELRFERFMLAMNWIEHRLDKDTLLISPMNKDKALDILSFIQRNGDINTPSPAFQWLLGQVSKYYSLSDIYNN